MLIFKTSIWACALLGAVWSIVFGLLDLIHFFMTSWLVCGLNVWLEHVSLSFPGKAPAWLFVLISRTENEKIQPINGQMADREMSSISKMVWAGPADLSWVEMWRCELDWRARSRGYYGHYSSSQSTSRMRQSRDDSAPNCFSCQFYEL